MSEHETREQIQHQWLTVTHNGVCRHKYSDTIGYCESCFWDMLADYKQAVEREQAAEIEWLAVLRRVLWLNHGCTALYGDDGEMQCNAPHPNGSGAGAIGPLDFKRDSLERLASAICSLLRYHQMQEREQAAEIARLRAAICRSGSVTDIDGLVADVTKADTPVDLRAKAERWCDTHGGFSLDVRQAMADFAADELRALRAEIEQLRADSQEIQQKGGILADPDTDQAWINAYDCVLAALDRRLGVK